jgi:hypothetical protein
MPTMQDVHIDQALSDYAFGVLQDNQNHVAGGFFPIQEVDHLSDQYYVLPRNQFARGDAKPRQGNAESAGFDFELSKDNFNCVPYALHSDVDQRKLSNSDNPRLYEEAATRVAVDNLLLTHEIDWANAYFKTGVWGKDYTGVASGPTGDQFLRWDDAAADPEKDVDKGKRQIYLAGGKEANALLVGFDVWLALKKCPKIIDRVKYTSADSISTAVVARLLGVEKLIVAQSTKATNAVGAADAYDFVHGKGAMLAHVGENGGGELQASAGRIFAWKGVNPGALRSRTLSVARIEIPLKKSVRFEAETNWGHKVTGQQLAAFFATAVA